MSTQTAVEKPALVDGRPEGQLEYELRNNIRDFSRIYGPEQARAVVAEFLAEELGHRSRRPRHG